MYYVNVSNHGEFYFATQPKGMLKERAMELLRDLEEAFPKMEVALYCTETVTRMVMV